MPNLSEFRRKEKRGEPNTISLKYIIGYENSSVTVIEDILLAPFGDRTKEAPTSGAVVGRASRRVYDIFAAESIWASTRPEIEPPMTRTWKGVEGAIVFVGGREKDWLG